MHTWLVTGGAGFLGANLVRAARARNLARVVTLDLLTYAGDRARLAALDGDAGHVFVHGDVGDGPLLDRLLAEHRPVAVLHLAAETHVDRSIDGPEAFHRANLLGTQSLLEAARRHHERLRGAERDAFRVLCVSTDEVYGTLGPTGRFGPDAPPAPRSPYAATKAAADHYVRAWHAAYGLPTLLTSGGNTYGPWQLPEKLLPLLVARALAGQPLPLYGDGQQVRDWIHVDDHVEALLAVLARGEPGSAWLVGGGQERTNEQLARTVCAALDRARPEGAPHARGIVHVADRPGHDRRYALDATALERDLGWRPRRGFEEGVEDTVRWYLEHRGWLARAAVPAQSARRLGLGAAR